MSRTTIDRMRALCLVCFMGGLPLLMGACGGNKGQRSQTPGGSHSGEVVERSEGYSERPKWADEEQPWSRKDDQLRVIGYVAISGKQRMEAGYKAADSYARAELLRFLSVRIVAVLEEQVTSGEPEILRESIEQSARGVIDDLPVSGRYYEKRKKGGEETVHIYSRVDMDQSTVLSLFERATAGNEDLRTSPEALLAKLKGGWDRLADVDELNQDETLLPNGFPRPVWAEKGDRSDDSGFEFVCSGVAADPKAAQSVAQARCNEKLCRLFGVQISAKTTVTEDLEGIDAQSQVTEQCADVRVEGRTIRYQSSECGPKGCVHWYLQSYPKNAYLAERKRLDQPQIIRQEVVIQEGDKHYRDPAACEASLRAFGDVLGQTSSAFSERKRHLQEALKVCQGIDGRESGLIQSLNTLLLRPLPSFTRGPASGQSRVSERSAYTIISPEWWNALDTMRFLTDRISAILALVDGAILPLKLVDLREDGGSSPEVEAAIEQVVQSPFTKQPVSEHHLYSLHEEALTLASGKKVAYSRRYRSYLLDQVSKARVECSSKKTLSGSSLIVYWGADGVLDEEEWQRALVILKNSPEGDAERCFSTLFGKQEHKGKKQERIEQIAVLIASGNLRSGDEIASFDRLLDQVEKQDRAALYFRHVKNLSGSAKYKERLAKTIAESTFGWDWEFEREKKAEGIRTCEALPARMQSFFSDVPEAKTEDTALCLCLRLDGLSQKVRSGLASLLFSYAEKTCDWIQPSDWPEDYYQEASPKTIPYRGRAPFGGNFRFIQEEIKGCIEQNSVLRSPHMVTFLTTTLRGTRFSSAKADTTIYGELKKFEYKKEGRGYVHASDVHAMTKKVETCIEEAANAYVLPELYSITKESGPHHLWLQIWDSNTGTNGFVEDLQK